VPPAKGREHEHRATTKRDLKNKEHDNWNHGAAEGKGGRRPMNEALKKTETFRKSREVEIEVAAKNRGGGKGEIAGKKGGQK